MHINFDLTFHLTKSIYLSSWETSLSSCGGSIVDQALLIAHTETRTGGQKLERGTTIFCSLLVFFF